MTKKSNRLNVKGADIRVFTGGQQDYISLTDIAKHKSSDRTDDLIHNWIRNRNTIEFLSIWELLNNPDFKPVEFDGFKKEAGLNSFTLTPKQWIKRTNAIGIISKSGRYGGTYAHKDIAFEFASWISVEFKLYLIKEFQRLKDQERKQLGWDIRRNLTKINYRIHTEADILNMALFGMTAAMWRETNPDKNRNIRDYANVAKLVCLINLENLNAIFINDGLSQDARLERLNKIAIGQMKILTGDSETKRLEGTE